MLVSYLLERRRQPTEGLLSLVSWAVGVAVGLTTILLPFTLTGAAVLDAFIAAAAAQLILQQKRRVYAYIEQR